MSSGGRVFYWKVEIGDEGGKQRLKGEFLSLGSPQIEERIKGE